MIAKIAVSGLPFAVDKPYSYRIPLGMQPQPGMRVMVPFGRGNQKHDGVVLSVEDGEEEELKTVDCCLDETPILSERMLRMAAFLRERYFCAYYDCLCAILPAGIRFQTKVTFSLTENLSWQDQSIRQADALAVLHLLQNLGGEAEESHLKQLLPEEKLEQALQYLLRKKWIRSNTDFSRKTGDKSEKIAVLASPAEEAMDYAQHCRKSAAMQKAVLETLCSVGAVSVKELCYYTGASTATVNRLADLGYLRLEQRPVLRCREIKPARLDGDLVLNAQQNIAFQGLSSQMRQEKPGTALLYGVTGSGKTSVYLKLIRSCLDMGKSALLLVPEIALTPQLLSLLAAHFGQQVAVLHSSLSVGERYDQWKRVKEGCAHVIVGTRSAVFAPSENLGIIILDEEQEHSYKSENAPRYDAREVAIWRGIKERTLVLFGSATPSVETMYRAKTGIYSLYTLPGRFNGGPLPSVQIVDLREELKNGNDLSVSTWLAEQIQNTKSAGKQSILFLNRRGNSRALVCVKCGEAPSCPRCSDRMVFHSANNRLMCHHCGYSEPTPRVCPKCGGILKRIGTGTQKVQEELLQIDPQLTVDRMDADTVNAVNTHEKVLEHFRENKVDVLLGTQMVAKGLNFPDVTLVGVLDADLGLYGGGYRAAESTFNMLTQVVGRAGRGDTPGQAVIQTLVPEHPVIKLAAEQDYDGFFDLEIGMRKVQKAPPFGDIAAIVFTGTEEAQVLRSAVHFRDSLLACLAQSQYRTMECSVLGPAPCAVPKINYNYRYRLTLHCKMDKTMRLLVGFLLRQFLQDKANRGVSAFADVNADE